MNLCVKSKEQFLSNKASLKGSRNIKKNVFDFYSTKLTTYIIPLDVCISFCCIVLYFKYMESFIMKLFYQLCSITNSYRTIKLYFQLYLETLFIKLLQFIEENIQSSLMFNRNYKILQEKLSKHLKNLNNVMVIFVIYYSTIQMSLHVLKLYNS